MNSIVLALLAFLFPVVGAGVGLLAHTRLPEHHLARDSTDVIKLATGLMATLVALVLSLLISSASNLRGAVEAEYKQAVAGIGQLDQRLDAYGPEAAGARQLLRRIVVTGARQHWPKEDFGAAPAIDRPVPQAVLDLERQILRLHPADEEQRFFRDQALQLVASLAQIQRLIANQERSSSFPLPVLIAVIACTAAIFSSFGLFVEPNPTVIGSLGVSALAVAGAVFLIIELNTPFSGLLQLPNAPIKELLATLGA